MGSTARGFPARKVALLVALTYRHAVHTCMFMYLLPESSEPLMIDLSSEGRPANDFHFTLTSETSAPYFIWAPNQPSIASENCVTLASDGYHDVGCGITSRRVCEFESK